MSLETRLIKWTTDHGRLNNRDNYIGLSKIGDCPRKNYYMYFSYGSHREEAQLLKFYQGYASEDDVVLRLKALGDYNPGIEIKLFDGLVRGHTDGSFEGHLVEIKSLAREEWIPQSSEHLPRKIWWQVQAYLRYTHFTRAYLIYLARDTGALKVFEIDENKGTGKRIHNRVHAIVRAIQNRTPPACECGTCVSKENK